MDPVAQETQVSGKNKTVQDFLENKLQQNLPMWSSRNALSPSKVKAGSHKMVWWVCEEGHEWEAMVCSVVLNGCGCPYCAGKKAIPGETDLETLRPDLLSQWDYEKNTLPPSEFTIASHDKVWWKCELGHSWQAVVFARTKEQATGCPYCTGRKVLAGFNDLASLKPKLAEQWHPTLNGKLRPEDVTLGSNKYAWWQCGEGHVWKAVIYSRTRRKSASCPVCAGKVLICPIPERKNQRKILAGTVRENRSSAINI